MGIEFIDGELIDEELDGDMFFKCAFDEVRVDFAHDAGNVAKLVKRLHQVDVVLQLANQRLIPFDDRIFVCPNV